MKPGNHQMISRMLIEVIRPIVRLVMRMGVPYQSFAEILKWVYVDTARREFQLERKKQTKSRISVLTGLSRTEVRKQFESDPISEPSSMGRWQRAGRVLSAWVENIDLRDNEGHLLALPMESNDGSISFTSLVEQHSGSATPRSILDELVRTGAVETDGSQVRLVRPYYLADSEECGSQQLDLVGFSASRLLDTLEHNTRPDQENLFFQRIVLQEGVPEPLLEEARAFIRRRGQELVNEIDCYLVGMMTLHGLKHGEHPVHQVGMGMYYYENDEIK